MRKSRKGIMGVRSRFSATTAHAPSPTTAPRPGSRPVVSVSGTSIAGIGIIMLEYQMGTSYKASQKRRSRRRDPTRMPKRRQHPLQLHYG